MKPAFRLPLWRLTELFGESNRPPRLQKNFNTTAGFMPAVMKAYMSQRYRPLNCPMFSFQ